MKLKVSDGLQKIVNTIRAVMTAEMVVAGYERTGHYPVDFAITLRQCTYTCRDDRELRRGGVHLQAERRDH